MLSSRGWPCRISGADHWGDAGEMQARCRGDAGEIYLAGSRAPTTGEMQARCRGCRGDAGEMRGRYTSQDLGRRPLGRCRRDAGDAGEMQGRCGGDIPRRISGADHWGDAGEMQARCRRDIPRRISGADHWGDPMRAVITAVSFLTRLRPKSHTLATHEL